MYVSSMLTNLLHEPFEPLTTITLYSHLLSKKLFTLSIRESVKYVQIVSTLKQEMATVRFMFISVISGRKMAAL